MTDDLTRRETLVRGGVAIGGALVLGFHLAPSAARAQDAAKTVPPPANPNAFIRIAADDSVTVISKHIEFGQGPYTGLATMACEELDADWSQMRVTSAPADIRLYANLNMGVQGTGGSSAMASSYTQMRTAAAAARAMLVLAAAQAWGVDPHTISVDRGLISHKASGRSGRFGEFAVAAAAFPVPPRPDLKDPAHFRLIGKDRSVGKVDSAAKTDGSAMFAIDQTAPGMLTVMVARSPRFGGKLAGFDAAAALKIKGVVAVKAISTGVAVYATGTWPAMKARTLIEARWNDSAAEMRGTEAMLTAYRAQAKAPGKIVNQHGDAEAGLARGRRVAAEFVFPYLAHAPMEPLDGFLDWNGTSARARFGSQVQTIDQGAIAKVLGLPLDKVSIETLMAGGSFGRRAQPVAELAVELAEVAKAIGPGRPVKLIRSREDDITGGYYRPMAFHRYEGSIENGVIRGWTSDIVAQSFLAGGPFAAMIKDGIDPTMTEGASELPYRTENFRCMQHMAESPVTTLWWRSVGHTHTGYGVECFVDQLLQADGRDPIEGRLALIEKPRAAGVLKAVAKLADWKGPGPVNGRARGVAVVESFNTFVAHIAEVSLDPDGHPRVHKVWSAVDLGVAINPDVIRAQIEGAVGYALGHALYAEVALDDGIPVARNFDGYRSLRIQEMPEVEVVIVPSAEPPTGIGEPGVPPLAPAVANAIARLGRERPARLPMVRA